VPHAGAWRTKRRIFTTNYEPKSPVRHASDRSTKKPSLFEVPCSHLHLPRQIGDAAPCA
jgi:hypothetical protein